MNEREEVCKNNFLRVKSRLFEPIDSSDKQFFATGLREIWSSFEAYLGWKFPSDSNREMRKLFSDKYQNSFNGWKMSDSFKASLEKLRKLSPVQDMSPVNPRQPKTINDPTSLFEILDVCYRVRSNLDHGAKELESETENGVRNRELAEKSSRITYEILEKVLLIDDVIQK